MELLTLFKKWSDTHEWEVFKNNWKKNTKAKLCYAYTCDERDERHRVIATEDKKLEWFL